MGRTVAELHATMSADEYQSWMQFFSLYPFDDFHRFHRPAALVSASMSGGAEAFADRLEVLQPDPVLAGMTEADRSILKAMDYTAQSNGRRGER